MEHAKNMWRKLTGALGARASPQPAALRRSPGVAPPCREDVQRLDKRIDTDQQRCRRRVEQAAAPCRAGNPLDTEGVSAKARGLMAPVLGAEKANKLIDLVNGLEPWTTFGRSAPTLRCRLGRPGVSSGYMFMPSTA